jgi:hypothetical protein
MSADSRVYYCENDLPNFLRKPEYAGRVNAFIDAPKPAPEAPAKKKATKTSIEETPTTETPAEAEGE